MEQEKMNMSDEQLEREGLKEEECPGCQGTTFNSWVACPDCGERLRYKEDLIGIMIINWEPTVEVASNELDRELVKKIYERACKLNVSIFEMMNMMLSKVEIV